MPETSTTPGAALVAELLQEFQLQMEVRVLRTMSLFPTSPFLTRHDSKEGVFYIQEGELRYPYCIVHEFGHLVAWSLAGKPQVDDFGCADVEAPSAEALEFSACCIEIALRRTRLKEDPLKLEKLLLEDYAFGESLQKEEVTPFMERAYSHGRELLEKWAQNREA